MSGAVPPAALGIDAATYRRWLDRKAIAHVRRDRARGRPCSAATYRKAIHDAVVASEGRDAYTGEVLDWTLISTYCNTHSALRRHAYKRTLALLPTVDHVEADAPTSAFRICAWRTNDAKNDLSVEAFVALCRRVVAHAENATAKPAS